jgi:hypothetical protein
MALIADQQFEKQGKVADTPIQRPDKRNVAGETEDVKALRLVQAANIKAETDELDILEAFSAIALDNPGSGKSRKHEEAKRFQEQTFHDARDLFINQALNKDAPEEGLQAIQEVQVAELQAQTRDSFDTDRYTDAVSKDLTPAEKEDLRARLHLLDKLEDFTNDISGWELTRDIALSVVLAPKDLWDNMQAFGSLNPFKAQETFRGVATWFQQLSPEDKIAVWPAIQEDLVEAMPRHRAAIFMQGLLDPSLMAEGESELGFWGTIDAAAIGVGIAASALKLRKLLNPIRTAAKAGSKDQASSANLAVMQGIDDGVGEAVGVDRTTANTNALPFDSSDIDDAAAAGEISPAVHERIFAFRDRLKEAFGDMSEAKTFVREGFLDTQDRTLAISRLNDEYARYVADRYQGKDKIVNLTSKKERADGVDFEFEVTDAEGNITKDVFRGQFTLDDIGFWQTLPNKSVFFSEKTQANKTDFMSTVKAAIRLDNTAAAVSTQLRRVIKDASKPIRGFKGKPRKQRVKEVDDVLVAGDDMEKEFTPQELMAGVNGIKLDEDQIEYYYNMRGVMNGLGLLRNMDARRAMEARGVKTITIGSDNFFGEVIDTAGNAARRVKERPSIWKVDGEGGRQVNTAHINMEDEYAKGFRLVQLEDDTFFGGNRYRTVLVKSDSTSDLPAVVLDLKKGYIPRVNPKATYFVQALTPSRLDGVEDTLRRAVRSFDNKKEADAFASRMFTRARDEGFSENTTFRVVEDGELEAFRAGDSGVTQTGGLVYGKRARTKIPHNDGDASDVPRTSALEAIELYLENTKNFMTRNEWRMGLRKKWENTASFHLGGTRVSFDDPGAALSNSALKTAHEKIQNFSGFMDKSERAWEQTVKGVYEWALNGHKIPFTNRTITIGRNRISDFILSQRQKDPLTRLRSATFHTLLGFFNPIQLWVQAQGAAVAMSVGLTTNARAAKVFQRQGVLTMMQHVNFDDSKKITSDLAKAFGYGDVEEMRATKQLWDKSGFHDSTLSSADVEAAARGFPTTGSALKRFVDSGLMFFRAGELFNRRFAFLTALDELGGAKKVLASDTLLKEALDRTNDLILNLGKSNRAAWQKGFFSIPTQFMQIQMKTIESVLGWNGALTKADRIKLLMGQFALYGTAGAFGANWAARQGAAMMGKDQIDINEMPDWLLTAITGGFTDFFLQNLIGADVTGADRGALLNGMDQTIFSLFTDESTAFEWLGGPSAVGPQRFWKKFRQLSAYFAAPQDINGQVSFEAQDVSDTIRDLVHGARGLAMSPFATGRQIDMFYLMQDLGVLRDQNGNLIAAPKEGFNWQTEWATLMGFKPEELQRKFDLSSINEDRRKTIEFRTALLLEGYDMFLMDIERATKEGRELTDEEIARHSKRRNVIINSVSDPGMRRKVMESFRNRLRERRAGNTQIDRQMQQFYSNAVFDLTDSIFDSQRLIKTRESDNDSASRVQ